MRKKQKKTGDTGDHFGSQKAALKYLHDEGYKVSQGKFSQDMSKGYCRVGDDGTIKKHDLMLYAAGFIKKVKPRKKIADDELEDLALRRAKAELELKLRQEEKIRFELEKDQGKYLPKEEVFAQFAMKWSFLEALIRQLHASRLHEWIEIVGGDHDKHDILHAHITDELDKMLNGLAYIDEIGIKLT